MLVTTSYFEYREPAWLGYTYCFVEWFYVSATSCVLSFPPVNFHRSAPENLLPKQQFGDTEPVHSCASGAERSCRRIHRAAACGRFRLGVREAGSVQRCTRDLNTRVLHKGNNGSCFTFVSAVLAGKSWIASRCCCVWHKANIKVLLQQPVGALTFFYYFNRAKNW